MALGYMMQLTIGPVAFASRNMAAAQSTCTVFVPARGENQAFKQECTVAAVVAELMNRKPSYCSSRLGWQRDEAGTLAWLCGR